MRSTFLQPTFFCLVSLITASHFLSASASDSHRRNLHINHLRHSRLQQRQNLPAGWKSLGCYTEGTNGRALTSASYSDTVAMTVESCVAYCNGQNYIYAGVEYASQCYCGDIITNGAGPAASTDCSFACPGNAAETCGAGNRLNMYWSGATPPPPPAVVPSVGNYKSLGCYSDNVNGQRALTSASYASNNAMTVESCVAYCSASNYIYAGLEYASQCFCGNIITNESTNVTLSECNMLCSGNSSEFCGAGNLLNMYSNGATPPPPPSDPATVGSWSSLGCYTDGNPRALSVGTTPIGGSTNNSVESCTAACFAAGYPLAGVEYSDECYCADSIGATGVPAAAGSCNMPCSGNANEFCGGPLLLNVYNYTGTGLGTTGTGPTNPPPGGPIVVPSVGPWVSLGCYTDGGPRALTYGTTPVGGAANNSVESCTSACFAAGYSLAGVEYSDECYCADSIGATGVPAVASTCDMPCSGNASEICGGPVRLNIYNYTGSASPGSGTGTGTGTGTSNGNGTTVTNLGGQVTDLPAPWEYNACWVDGANGGRVMQTQLPDNQALTIESCVSGCIAQGFTVAGAEYGVQCFCGNNLIDGAVPAPNTDCSMGCGGNSAEKCGGPNRLSVYTSAGSVTAEPLPTIQTTGLPGNWQYQECVTEPPGGRVFPLYMNTFTNNNSVDACLNICAEYGYRAAGLEYSYQCFCGDPSDVTSNGGTTAPASECNLVCSGDPLHYCGGNGVLALYTWTGVLNNANWQTPSNIGYYEFFMPGLVPPLLATLGINGKVSFLEKSGTSEYANSTGAYELDLSLVPNFNTAWRTMHLQTDVFCSAAVVLPDIAGRILNVGGWSLQSTYGIRLYAPDGSAGVNGTNDWEENPNDMVLQTARWYPTACVLSNGSVVVMGGEVGSNSAASPTLEILPKVGGLVNLDFLARTNPNNLYPFLMILPSGGLFCGYYNEARILDQGTFNTVTTLPNMPGSVTSFLGGRTYPMEGAAVLLPMSDPYSAPATVLVCGGSNFGVAIDNCVSIQPEVAGANWTIERMPSQRVMPCMVALPDGTFMIMNGAQEGVAGFGLAGNPNYNALLYDPTQPVGSRISILNNSTIARLYHSEATLLPDGSVLISGSDPQTPGFPEELRIERYVPPYLNQGLTQPVVTVPTLDWQYGKTYTINVQLFQGTTSGMRVSLVGAVSSTHGNTMGGRTLFPKFSCAGNTCTVTAPPNNYVAPAGWFQIFILDGPTPSHGVFIRIGGDPGSIGNWPAVAGFNPPGLGTVTSVP